MRSSVVLVPLLTSLVAGCGDDTASAGTGSGAQTSATGTTGATPSSADTSGPGSGGAGGATGPAGSTGAGGDGTGGSGGSSGCSQTGDGVWGEPAETFTLPTPTEANGSLYFPDLQDSFPDVDWQTLDRLYLPAGHWRSLLLGGLPQRDADDPLVITNTGGQVKIGGFGANYNVSIQGGAGWVLTGRHDPESGTGDAGFPGHRGCDYGGSRGRYGIFVDGAFDGAPMGVAVGDGATGFVLEHLEVTRVSFAGIMLKTDDTPDATMRDVTLNDLYVHDTASEGMYIGSTQQQPQHSFENLHVVNNRVLRTGTESFQIGQLGDGCEIHHNVFALGALDWKDPFQSYQDGGVQLGFRHGSSSFHHNVVIGAAGTMMAFFPQVAEGDAHADGDEVRVHDNIFSDGRNLGGYIFPDHDGVTSYSFERNAFRAFVYGYDEIDPEGDAPGSLIRTFNDSAAMSFVDNRWDGEAELVNALPGGEGTNGNVSGSGNVRGAIPAVELVDFMGWPEGTDPLLLEEWTATSEPLGGAPVIYQPGDFVMRDGQLYACIASEPHSGRVPPENPDTWEPLPLPVDDVRLRPGSPHAGIGLLDTP